MAKSSKRSPSPARPLTPESPESVALYCRVSTDDQAENETIQTQIDFLRRFADLHGHPIVGEYLDDGISGTVPLGERPEGRRLLQDAEAGQFTQVIFMRVSRLGRRLSVLLDAHDALDGLGIAIRSGTEPLDTSNAIGRFIFQLLGSVAELDRETISENTSRGRNRVAAKGQYTGGPIPIGLDLDGDRSFVLSARPVPHLNCTEAELIRDIFVRLAARQTTVHAEVQRLNALGVPRAKRYGGKNGIARENSTGWWDSSLRWVIKNPIYKGEGALASTYGHVTRPVPALIDAETWGRAQTALIANRQWSKKNAKHDYPLRGLIRCAICGGTYTGANQRGLLRYRCHGYTKLAQSLPERRCHGKQIPADWLEGAVWEECRRFILNPGEALDEARKRLRERMATSTAFEARRRSTLAALADKETDRERALTAYRKGWADDEETERQLDAIAREAGQLREELEAMRAQAALIDAQEAHLTEVAASLARTREDLAAIEATNDAAAKQEIVRKLVRVIEVETRRGEGRRLEADVRLFLRLQLEAIVIEDSTASPTSSWANR